MKLLKYLFIILPFFGFGQSADGTFKTVTASGTNSYTISEVLKSPDAYDVKEKWIITFINGNTGAVTINRNSLGAKGLKKLDGTDFSSGDIPAGSRFLVSYNGTYYQAIGASTSLAWGNITGTLSNQTDLQTALNTKQNTGNYITALTGDVTASGPGSVPTTVTKINGTSLAGLSTGILKNTTGTGIPSIAAANVDYQSAITFGTGVQSALGVNIGSAGAPVLFNGALGTPSSGVGTNLTGISLTTGVTGILPVANGGTGTASPSLVAGTNISITGTWPNQTINSSGATGTQYYGSFLSRTSFSNTSDFTNSGATVSIVSSAIQFTGGANTLTQYLYYPYQNVSEYPTVVGEFLVQGTINSTSYGFGLSHVSTNSYVPYGAYIKFDMTNTGTAGQVTIKDQGGTTLATSSSNVSFSLNDRIRIVYEQREHILNITVTNVTTGATPVTVSYVYSFISGAGIPNTGNFAIQSYGGTFSLASLSIFSNDVKSANICLVGDSKLKGYASSDISLTIENLLKNNFSSVVNLSGSADRTADVLNRIQEIINLAPSKVILCIGSNDVRSGVSSATYNANYDNIVTQLTNAGIAVYHLTLREYGGVDLTTLRTHITSTYSASNIIDFYPNMLASMMYSDNIHPSIIGNQAIVKAIMTSGIVTSPVTFVSSNKGQLFYGSSTFSASGRAQSSNLYWDESNNRLGIGTSSPSEAFHSYSTVNTPNKILIENTNGSGNSTFSGLQFKVGSASDFIYSTSTGYASADQSALIFQTGSGRSFSWSVAGSDQMTLGTTGNLRVYGNLGIGIAPTQPLHISKSTAGGQLILHENQNTGSSAYSGIELLCDGAIFLYKTSTSYSTSALANAIVTQSQGAKFIWTPDGSVIDMQINSHNLQLNSKMYIGGTSTTPTDFLDFAAGTTSIAPIGYTSGSLLTTIAVGKSEYNNAYYESTNALNRYGKGGSIADFTSDVNNSGTSETDIFTYTTKASTLAATGEKLVFEGSGTFNDLTATADVRFYFGGTSAGDTGALTISATGAFTWRLIVIRTGSSTARARLSMSTPGASTAQYTTETDITGLTFTNTNIIKMTAQAGGASGGSNDITGKEATIFWWAAANN